MNLIKNAAVRDHLSARRRQIVFPFAPASHAEAAGRPGDEPRQARISNVHRQSGQARSSGTASITDQPSGVTLVDRSHSKPL